ncbi:hypothetical protein LCGC14_1928340 [marine sediment metagenome]|uniref:Uncharacterized protein n=1 Tax=marine sediment metagenome TaxID=412755 RepID=A0A0F9FNR5_9ZZZZ
MSESASVVQFPEGTQIIPIHPLAKYVVSVPRAMLPEDDEEFADHMRTMAINLTEWWNDDNPFMIITDEMTLVKIGEVDILLEEEDDEEKT